MTNFNEKLPEWMNAGAEPPVQKKTDGWQTAEKPPAGWFNWLFNRAYKCLEEIRNFTDGLAGSGRTTETVKGNADAIATHKAEMATQSNGVHGIKMESGVWQPVISASTTAPNVDYEVQRGSYERVGNIVSVKFFIRGTLTGGEGIAEIHGLPFVTKVLDETGNIGRLVVGTTPKQATAIYVIGYNLTYLRVVKLGDWMSVDELIGARVDISGSITYKV